MRCLYVCLQYNDVVNLSATLLVNSAHTVLATVVPTPSEIMERVTCPCWYNSYANVACVCVCERYLVSWSLQCVNGKWWVLFQCVCECYCVVAIHTKPEL